MSNDFFEKIIIPIVSALLGAAIGAYFAHTSQKNAIIRNDKKIILAQLMGSRHDASNDNDFVKALNMAVLIFHNNKAVKDAVHQYITTTGAGFDFYSGGQRLDAFFSILSEMGKDIGYKDLTRNDVRDFFSPSRPAEPPKGDNTIN